MLSDLIMMSAHEKGFQITSHAVGDRGVDIISRAIENALNAIPKNDHRNRIEHCAIINEELLERIKRFVAAVLAAFGTGVFRQYAGGQC